MVSEKIPMLVLGMFFVVGVSFGVVGLDKKLNPKTQFGKVNLGKLLEDKQAQVASRIKAGATEAELKAIAEDMAGYGKRLEGVIAQVAGECKCTLMNSAALLHEGLGVNDFTPRVAELLGSTQK